MPTRCICFLLGKVVSVSSDNADLAVRVLYFYVRRGGIRLDFYSQQRKQIDMHRIIVMDSFCSIHQSGQRQEECSPGGCYMELCMQMAIIFVGKQFLLSVVEYHLPRLWKLYNSFKVMTGIAAEERDGKRQYPQWIHDFKLADFGDQGLFYEYLEMSKSSFLFWLENKQFH